MIDYSNWTDEEINEAIFEVKGYKKTQHSFWVKHEQNGTLMSASFGDLPDYVHDWMLCGELWEEIPNYVLNRRGDRWYCGARDDIGYLSNQDSLSDTPKRAICIAYLIWRKEQR